MEHPYKDLRSKDYKKFVESKGQFAYLSWAKCLDLVKQIDPYLRYELFAIYAFCSIDSITKPERNDAPITMADIFSKDLPLGKVKLDIAKGRFLDSKIP